MLIVSVFVMRCYCLISISSTLFRLGEYSTAKDALLLSERQEKDTIKKALAEAGERNEELLMKIEDTNEKIEHLQNTIIKSVPPLMLFG